MDYPADHNQHHQYYSQYPQQVAYDPSSSSSSSQAQLYDQSAANQAYYSYCNQQYNQQYPYHPQKYSNSYQQQTQLHYSHEPASIHPPGVPIPTVSTQTTAADQQNAYYAQYALENQKQQNQQANFDMELGSLNSAAHTQIVGNMHPRDYIGMSFKNRDYRGGGRRGGRPFRGGRRGSFGNHGRGRGRGGGRHSLQHGAASPAPAEVNATSASFPDPAPESVPIAPSWPPPRMVWCELCRVDCNTAEILEQHKNGKRHKKNLLIQEQFKNLNKVITGEQSVQVPISASKSEVVDPEKVEVATEVKTQADISTPLTVNPDNLEGTVQHKDPEHESEVSLVNSSEAKRKSSDPSESWNIPPKRRKRGGRGGGRHTRSNEGHRMPVAPSKPKEVIPFICELCNVKCESQVVFDSHLTGKKHLSNVKRFHGHQAIYGEAGLQALYPPNFNAPSSSSSTPQVQQGITDPQVLLAQLLNYVIAQAQAQAQGPGFVHPSIPGPASGFVPPQIPNPASRFLPPQFPGPVYGIVPPPLVPGAGAGPIPPLASESAIGRVIPAPVQAPSSEPTTGIVSSSVPELVTPRAPTPPSEPTTGLVPSSSPGPGTSSKPTSGAEYHRISKIQVSQGLSEAENKTASTIQAENVSVTTSTQPEPSLPGILNDGTSDVTASTTEEENEVQDNSNKPPSEKAEVVLSANP